MSVAVEAAMVFAAGRGERMRPLSDVLPKPALPLPDGPVVASALRVARSCGAGVVVVNTWHLAERMEAAVRGVEPGPGAVRFSREPELMGTAGGLALARQRGLLTGTGPLLAVNGDCRTELDLAGLLDRHRREGDLVTLAVQPNPDPRRWSQVRLGAGGRVEGILPPGPPEAGEVPYLYLGVMLVAREALARLPVAVGGVAERLWAEAGRQGRLGAAVVPGTWREVGDPETYLAVVLELLGPRPVVDRDAAVGRRAEVVRSLIGPHAGVGEGAVVVDSVVAAGALVGARARVRASVLLGAVEVSAGAVVEGVRRAVFRADG